jgi:type II secretory pathway pseudopilin PulG
MELASVIIAGLSLALASFVWFDARRSAKSAELDAARAVKAAEDSARAAERSATASEQQLDLAMPPTTAFRVDFVAGATYALRNIGTAVATGVTIAVEGTAGFVNVPADVTLAPQEAFEFMARGTNLRRMPTDAPVRCNELPDVVHVAMP